MRVNQKSVTIQNFATFHQLYDLEQENNFKLICTQMDFNKMMQSELYRSNLE